MRVLVVGGGGREHAIAWKLSQSPKLRELFVAPGNAGTAQFARNLPIRANDLAGIARAAREHRIDLVVVGPEEPLALGLADRLAVEGIACFGPTRAAARIEASKAFARQFMARHNIPQPSFQTFSSPGAARAYIKSLPTPPVVKADGLAAGKGSIVAESQEEALRALEAIMEERAFGDAGRQVVIEERLYGREVSVFAFTDGVTVVPMTPACDYKRLRDGDQGPNTGGMGSFSPPPWYDELLERQVNIYILEATVKALMAEGLPYRGVLYGGLMVTEEGPKVLEFNCRFGDPEAQVILPRLKSDLLEILWAVVMNRLHEVRVEWRDEACVGVVMASGGYPNEYKTGYPITGLERVEEDVLVFHAGTRLEEGRVVTAGGRVLTVVALGQNLAEARNKVYRHIARIHFTNCHYRHDIAAPAGLAAMG